MPNGRSFTTPMEMKKELRGYYKDQVADNMIRRMLAYAIGRKMVPHDRVLIDKIATALKDNEYRMSILIEKIIMSKQFQMRQDGSKYDEKIPGISPFVSTW